MRKILPLAAAAAAALALGACDKPRTNSAYINSGQSATGAMPAEPLAPPQTPEQAPPPAVTTAPATSDTASPNTAPVPERSATPASDAPPRSPAT